MNGWMPRAQERWNCLEFEEGWEPVKSWQRNAGQGDQRAAAGQGESRVSTAASRMSRGPWGGAVRSRYRNAFLLFHRYPGICLWCSCDAFAWNQGHCLARNSGWCRKTWQVRCKIQHILIKSSISNPLGKDGAKKKLNIQGGKYNIKSLSYILSKKFKVDLKG